MMFDHRQSALDLRVVRQPTGGIFGIRWVDDVCGAGRLRQQPGRQAGKYDRRQNSGSQYRGDTALHERPRRRKDAHASARQTGGG